MRLNSLSGTMGAGAWGESHDVDESTAEPHVQGSAVDRQRRIRRLRVVARFMDSAVRIPGLNVRFGLDPIIGLLPVAGDVLTSLVSIYIVYEGIKLGATRGQIAQMLLNIAIDTTLGAVPVVGDVFDVAFKANKRNLRILGIDPTREADAGPTIIDQPPGR